MLVFRTGGLSGFMLRSNQIRGNLRNQSSPLDRGIRAIKAWTRQNILSGGTLAEANWPSLAARTIAEKRRLGVGQPERPLIRTGYLLSEWTTVVANTWASLTSKAGHSGFHQWGSGKVPQRRIFPTEEQAVKLLLPIFHHHVKISIS